MARRSARSWDGDGVGSQDALVGNLPAGLTSFFGRRRELDVASGLLGESRLLTVTGPPGIGKTRLAVEVARDVAGAHTDGVWLVELAAVSDPALVAQEVARALSLPEVPGQSRGEALISRLRERRMLLVLDNCEHLLGASGELVDALLRGCRRLSVLTTSQEPLQITGEAVFQVPPLSVPSASQAAPDDLEASEAVWLFVERARAVQPAFALTDYVAPAVGEVCRRLDGIPLAIELAAARIEVLTADEIARRLEDRFGLLTKGSRSVLARHQTLAAAVDWSYGLLGESERVLLRRLSVFTGGFELAAAETVCAGEGLASEAIFDVLAALVSKSLVTADTNSSIRARYGLLETIRAYAAQRLEEAGEAAELRAAHASWSLGLAERAEPELTGGDQQRWFEHLETEHPNLRLALAWLLGQCQAEQALRLAGALTLYWRVRCYFSEGRELLHATLAASDGAPAHLRAKALWGAGFMAHMMGDEDAAVASLEESLSQFRELKDPQGSARALLILGNAIQVRDRTRALALLAESATLARQAGDAWCLAHALGVAGYEHAWREELPIARELFEQCLAVAREAEDQQGLRYGLIGLGLVALRQGDLDLAESVLEEAVAVTELLGEDYSRAVALESLGELAITRGDHGRARELLDDALVLHRELGFTELNTLESRATLALAAGERPGARAFCEKALDSAHARENSPSRALRGLGELAGAEGDAARARRLLEEALAAAREHGEKGTTAKALYSLGQLARTEGDLKRAAALHDEALGLRCEITSGPGTVASLEALAGLAAAAGRPQHAARLFGAAQARRNENGWARSPWDWSWRYDADMALVRQALPVPDFEAGYAQGAKLSLEQAVAQASKGRGPRGRPASGWSSLTDAERRVAELAAEGLTTPEIAERLFVSPGTVKTHLSHIFAKLGIGGRRELRPSLDVDDSDA